MDLKNQIISNTGWNFLGLVWFKLIRLFISILLARLLSPKDFGLISMVLVFVGFTGLASDLGFVTSLVQKKDLQERHIHSVFCMNLVSGFLCCVALFLAAPAIAGFYREVRLVPITRVMAFSFIFDSIGCVPQAVMEKNMRFRALAKGGMVLELISGIVAITMAFMHYGVWSLVAHRLVGSGLGCLILFKMSGLCFKPQFDLRALKELYRFSVHFFGFNMVNYLHRNVDNLIIGKIFGSVSLGFYNLAYAIMLLPYQYVLPLFNNIMFSTFSSIQDDKPRVKKIYLKTVGVIALFAFPMMMGIFVLSRSFILVVYGRQWTEVIPLVKLLSLVGLLQAVYSSVGWIYTSQGRTDLMFRQSIFNAGVLIIGILIGVSFGSLRSVAIGYVAANILIFYPCIRIPGRIIGMTFQEFLKALFPVFFVSLIMALGVWGSGYFFPADFSIHAVLLIRIGIGVISYMVFLKIFKVQSYQEACELICEKFFLRTNIRKWIYRLT